MLARRIWVGHRGDHPSKATRIELRPAVLAILGYALTLVVLTYLWRIVVPLGRYWPIVGLPSPAYLPPYASLFVVGVIACRRGCAQTLPVSAGWFVPVLFLGMIVASVAIVSVTVGSKLDIAIIGGGTWQPVALATWESLADVGILVALFVLFRERFNRQGRLARTMSELAYTVYIIHPLVLVALNYAFKWLNAIAVVKFLIVAVLAIPLCWISTYVGRSLPYAKRVL